MRLGALTRPRIGGREVNEMSRYFGRFLQIGSESEIDVMSAPARRAVVSCRQFMTLALFCAAGMAGCSGGRLSPEQQVDEAFKNSKAKKLEVVPFQGTVTIDGQAPSDNVFLCIFL